MRKIIELIQQSELDTNAFHYLHIVIAIISVLLLVFRVQYIDIILKLLCKYLIDSNDKAIR